MKAWFDELLPLAELVEISTEARTLLGRYVSHGAITQRWAPDGLHVAAASVTGCSLIVSWNFEHIVNFRRIPLYNAANTLMGYGPVGIHSPLEVALDEEDL